MRDCTATALSDFHIKISAPTLPVRSMSNGQWQTVAIGRAHTQGRQRLILDETTAALGVEKTKQVWQMTEKLRRDQQTHLLVISHSMQAGL